LCISSTIAYTALKIRTTSSAVAVIADRTADDVRYCCKPLPEIAVVSVIVYLFTVSLFQTEVYFSPWKTASDASQFFLADRCVLWLNTAKVSEEVNRKLLPQCTASQTDRQTVGTIISVADHTLCSNTKTAKTLYRV